MMTEIVASSEVSETEQLVHATVKRCAQFDSVTCSGQKSFTNHLGCTSTQIKPDPWLHCRKGFQDKAVGSRTGLY